MSSSDYLVEPGLSDNINGLLSKIQDRYKKKLNATQAVSVSKSDTDKLVKLLANTFKLPPVTSVPVPEPVVLPPTPPANDKLEPIQDDLPTPPIEQNPLADSLSPIIDEQEQNDNGEQPSTDVFPPPPLDIVKLEPTPIQLSDNTIQHLVKLLHQVFNKPANEIDQNKLTNDAVLDDIQETSGEESSEEDLVMNSDDFQKLSASLDAAQKENELKLQDDLKLPQQPDDLKLSQQANESAEAAALTQLNDTREQANKANEQVQAQIQQLRKASVLKQLAQSKVKLAEYHMGNAQKELELEKQQHAAVLNELNAYKNELTKAKETLVKVQSEGDTANAIQLNEAQAAVATAQTNEQEKAKELEEKTKELEQAQTKALEQTSALVKATELEQAQSTALKEAQVKQIEMQAEAKSIAEELKKAQRKLTYVQELSKTQAQQRYMNIEKTRDLVTRFQTELANAKALEQTKTQELSAAIDHSTQLEQELAQIRADYANAQPSYVQQITDWIKHYVPDFVSAKAEEPTVYKVDENALPSAVKQKMDNNYTYLGRIYMKDDVGKTVQTKYILWNNATHDYFSYNDPQ